VFAVGTDGNLYSQVDGQFEAFTAISAEFQGKVVSTASDPEGNPWLVHANGTIFGHYNNTWVKFTDESAKKIFFGQDGNLYIHTAREGAKDYDLKVYEEDADKFREIEGGASVDADVDANGIIWGIDAEGQVMVGKKLVTGTYQFLHIKEALAKAIAVAEDGTLALVDSASGAVGLLSPDRSKAILDISGRAAARVSIGVDVLFIVGTDGKAYSIKDSGEDL